MNIKHIFSYRYLKAVLLLVVGFFAGWLFFHAPKEHHHNVTDNSETNETASVWTCSMHPQIRMDKPGKCPLCGMDLIKVSTHDGAADPDALEMTEDAMRLADVQTTMVSTQNLTKTLQLYGKVQADERVGQTLAAHIPGRIDRLLVNATGETVRKGQAIATIYSPELVTTQNDLLQARRMGEQGKALAEAARRKLKAWKLSDEQITAIEQSGKVQTEFNLYSDMSGVIIAKRVNEGDYVAQGTPLYDISALDNVWILFDAYENDLPWLHKGDQVTFTAKSFPGKEYKGRIAFIEPVLDPQTRTIKVRVEYRNNDHAFKPGMYVTGLIESHIVNKSGLPAIPNSAILWTGNRSIVYVKDPETEKPVFRMREVTLDVSLGDATVIEKGLKEGEEVVINGTFEIDAAAQLAGKPSMMNQPSGMTGRTEMTKGGDIQVLDLGVRGLCSMCKKNIETAALSVKGVQSAEWDSKKQSVHLVFDKQQTNQEAIEKAITAVGYDTENFKAPDEVYEKLAPCCHYRE